MEVLGPINPCRLRHCSPLKHQVILNSLLQSITSKKIRFLNIIVGFWPQAVETSTYYIRFPVYHILCYKYDVYRVLGSSHCHCPQPFYFKMPLYVNSTFMLTEMQQTDFYVRIFVAGQWKMILLTGNSQCP